MTVKLPILQTLDAIGLYRYRKNLHLLQNEISVRVNNTLSQTKDYSYPLLAHGPSFFKRSDASPTPNTTTLIVDIGGTKTAALLREVTSNEQVLWHPVFNEKNELFDCDSHGDPFQSYIMDVLQKICVAKTERGIKNISGAAWTWSNGGASQLIPSHVAIKGNDIIVAGRQHYSKHEPFIKKLCDGVNIGEVIRSQFASFEWSPKVFHMENDTVYCALAYPRADGGMIASSGANATLVNSQGYYCNPEIGVNVTLDEKFLSFPESSNQKTVLFEALFSGKMFPKLFSLNLTALSKEKEIASEEFSRVADRISFLIDAQKLLNEALSAWSMVPSQNVNNEETRIQNSLINELEIPVTQTTVYIIRVLLDAMIERAGVFAGFMAYGSLMGNIHDEFWNEQSPKILALDSSMQRGYTAFVPLMQKQVGILFGPSKPVRIEYIEPLLDGAVSVPSLGMARASDELYQEVRA